MRIYDCCTISRCIIDMTGEVLEEEGRMLYKEGRGGIDKNLCGGRFCGSGSGWRRLSLTERRRQGVIRRLLCRWRSHLPQCGGCQ